jgi:hypothetical protein
MSERFAKRMAILLLIAVVLVAITNEGYPLRSALAGAWEVREETGSLPLTQQTTSGDGIEPHHHGLSAIVKRAYEAYADGRHER